MKTYALEFVLFGWIAYNIAIEIVSWFDKEDEIQAPPAIESTPAYEILESGTDFPIEKILEIKPTIKFKTQRTSKMEIIRVAVE